MNLKLTPTMPLAQKTTCSICKKEKYSVSDFAIAYPDGTLVCYECEKKMGSKTKRNENS